MRHNKSKIGKLLSKLADFWTLCSLLMQIISYWFCCIDEMNPFTKLLMRKLS